MIGIYPGSFDPITNGHLDIIERASKKVDKLFVVVFINHDKKGFFSYEERIDMISKSTLHLKNVIIDKSDKMVTDYCKEKGIDVIFRGLRNVTDFESELNMAHTNLQLNNECETLFISSKMELSNVSSSLVRELFKYGKSLNNYVSNIVSLYFDNKIDKKYKIIGLYGPSGAGKSTVSRIICENYNALHIDLDKVVSNYYDCSNLNLHKDLALKFGLGIFNHDKTVNKVKLANIVFDDKEKLNILESIVHPYVITNIIKTIYENKDKFDYIVIDGAILNKFKLNNIIDLIIKIEANEQLRLNRVTQRDNISLDKIIKRFKCYDDYNYYDFKILNNGNIEVLKHQIDTILDKK